MKNLTVEQKSGSSWIVGIPTTRNGQPHLIKRNYRVEFDVWYWQSLNENMGTEWQRADKSGPYVQAILKHKEKAEAPGLQVFY